MLARSRPSSNLVFINDLLAWRHQFEAQGFASWQQYVVILFYFFLEPLSSVCFFIKTLKFQKSACKWRLFDLIVVLSICVSNTSQSNFSVDRKRVLEGNTRNYIHCGFVLGIPSRSTPAISTGSVETNHRELINTAHNFAPVSKKKNWDPFYLSMLIFSLLCSSTLLLTSRNLTLVLLFADRSEPSALHHQKGIASFKGHVYHTPAANQIQARPSLFPLIYTSSF